MYKLAKMLYKIGRRQGYLESVNHLERLYLKLPKSRESQLIGNDVMKVIEDLKAEIKETNL